MTKLEILAKSVQDKSSSQLAARGAVRWVGAMSGPAPSALGFEAMPRRSPSVIHKQHQMEMQKHS